MQCPTGYPKWVLNADGTVLESCKSAAGFTQCTGATPISLRDSIDGGLPGTLVGCKAAPATGSACPAAFPNSVPSSQSYSFFVVNAAGNVTECHPKTTGNTCTGLVPVADATNTVIGCSSSTSSCPDSYYPMYGASSSSTPPNAAVVAECRATLPAVCTPPYSVRVYSTVLGAASSTAVGCKSTAAACPASSPVMQLSEAVSITPYPDIGGCYASYGSTQTCPTAQNATYTVPICALPGTISGTQLATACMGTAVKGCMAGTSTKCFSQTLLNNGGPFVFTFIIADLNTTNVVAPTIERVVSCYDQPSNIITCPGGYLRATYLPSGPNAACVNTADATACYNWFLSYAGANGACNNN